ncbi:hypothetical protein SETIT_2G024700v2 [Setaria italica]|uniref:Uncharacterized protein n=1 Tax=Setaria italica TaxID=4555 RepID=A0A368PVC0_SETIT|nr:hypothetical protein SETIT_2G024700v2 [Setaria italica]
MARGKLDHCNTTSERAARGELIRRNTTRRQCTASLRPHLPHLDVQHIGSALVGSGVRSVGVDWSNMMATTAWPGDFGCFKLFSLMSQYENFFYCVSSFLMLHKMLSDVPMVNFAKL